MKDGAGGREKDDGQLKTVDTRFAKEKIPLNAIGITFEYTVQCIRPFSTTL